MKQEIIRSPERVSEEMTHKTESSKALLLALSGLLLYLVYESIDGPDFGPLDLLKIGGGAVTLGGIWSARAYFLGPSMDHLMNEYVHAKRSEYAHKVN
ncbi:MAG: hypothetical protein ACJKTH_03665 [Patescibacteria group bacterium UBA2163]